MLGANLQLSFTAPWKFSWRDAKLLGKMRHRLLLRDDYFPRHWSTLLLASNGILSSSISRDKVSKHAVTAERVDPDENEAVYISCL